MSSERAIAVNIQIIRLFTQMREVLMTHKDLLLRMEQLENQVSLNSEDIETVFTALKQLLQNTSESKKRSEIGYKK